ncbi:MAG: MBL fold metallo-hydrolase, partial [Bacteroidota bacterium]
VIESQDKILLIDPMTGKKGTAAPPFSIIRFKPIKNPILDLPNGAMELIEKTTHCLITHLHADHLDKSAVTFLKDRQIPITCSSLDKKELIKRGLNIVNTIEYWKSSEFLGGTIEGIPARHGYGFVAKPMGNVMGYYIKFPNEESVYLSSDTIYTADVKKVLTEYKPDISVVACGSAQLDLFQPLLMTMEDIVRFVKDAPNKVICNHLEAVNHCPTTRLKLKSILQSERLLEKTWIPNDGDIKDY